MALIGIDLGTTNSLVTAYKNNEIVLIPNKLNNYMTKSAVSFLDDNFLVGDIARERLITHPQNSAAYFKQHMGTEHEYTLHNKQMKAHELSALVLKQLKADAESYLGEAITEAIISVPAYFNDNQRSATKLAASLAGLKANRLINEPSAAALYHRNNNNIQEGKLLVIDFGGGTLDVSIVDCFEEMVEILAISGDNHLGGKDIDSAIANYFFEKTNTTEKKFSTQQIASLYRSCEEAKIALANTDTVWLGIGDKQVSLNNAVMAELCATLFLRVKECIVKAVSLSKISIKEITDIVLVGGSSQLTVFVDFLENIFGVRPKTSEKAEHMVAMGLGLCCGIKNKEIKDVFMTDVCPFSLGIGVHNAKNPKRPLMSMLISRCSVLPSSVTHTYYTVYDGQSSVHCTICQGENMYEDENLKLGKIVVEVPPAPAGHSWVRVTFTYTIDGILQVKAVSCGGDSKETLILNPHLKLSESEIAEKLKEIAHLEKQNPGGEIDMLIFATLERLYFETTENDRDIIQALYRQLEQSILKANHSEHRQTREEIQNEIELLKYNLNPSLRFDTEE